MRDEAIFLNGVYESVLQRIFEIQSVLPETSCFYQPYKGAAIAASEHSLLARAASGRWLSVNVHPEQRPRILRIGDGD